MRNRGYLHKFIVLGISVALMISGCGGGFVDLSEDESKKIVNYSTDVLSNNGCNL